MSKTLGCRSPKIGRQTATSSFMSGNAPAKSAAAMRSEMSRVKAASGSGSSGCVIPLSNLARGPAAIHFVSLASGVALA